MASNLQPSTFKPSTSAGARMLPHLVVDRLGDEVGGDEGPVVGVAARRRVGAELPEGEDRAPGPLVARLVERAQRVADTLGRPDAGDPARVVVPAALGDVERL